MSSIAATPSRLISPSLAGPLTPPQVASFEREGYLVIDQPLIPSAEITWARQTIEALFERGAGREEGRNLDLTARAEAAGPGSKSRESPNPTRQILHPWLFAPELRRLSFRETALAIAKQLIGPNAVPHGEHSILKPARHGGITPWHQDEAFRDPAFDYREISVWIALTDATEANGAVRYVPSSHLGAVREHRPYGGVPNACSIECVEPIDVASTHLATLPAGGIAIHHGRTIHGAGPNTTDAPRLGYILVFGAPPVRRTEPRTFPWRTQYGGIRSTQRRSWHRRGGMLVEQVRRVRFGPIGDRCYRWYRAARNFFGHADR